MTDRQAMMKMLSAQRAAFMAELPVGLDIRKDRLRRLGIMTAEHADRFCAAMSEDFGHRSVPQSQTTDISTVLMAVKSTLDQVHKWMKRDRRSVPFPMGLLGAKAWVDYQPKGVVGVIAPWNFPVQLTVVPIAGAFAAGNRVMAKCSEATPATTALFEEIAGDYFDPTELALVSGGPEVGAEFAALPFDHIIFTGATGIARHVLHAAADNLVPVTLELGGKSPTVVGRSADLAEATGRIAMGKMLNAGQICLAPDYALVPSEKEGEFVSGITRAVGEMYPTLLANDDYSSVVNARHHARLTGYLDDARAKGAEVIEGNPGGEDFSRSNGHKMPLHLVLNPTDDMKVMQEEIFGPILAVRRYDRIDEVIDHVNAHDRPLALYYFGSDQAEREKVIGRTISGGVTFDDVLFHCGIEDLPFGGVGPSGMGAYHGFDGFREFSHAKAVYSQGRLNFAKLGGMVPPYGKTTQANLARNMQAWRKLGAKV